MPFIRNNYAQMELFWWVMVSEWKSLSCNEECKNFKCLFDFNLRASFSVQYVFFNKFCKAHAALIVAVSFKDWYFAALCDDVQLCSVQNRIAVVHQKSIYWVIKAIPIREWKDESAQEGFSWCTPFLSLPCRASEENLTSRHLL